MTLKKVLDFLTENYSEHEDYDEMITDLNDDEWPNYCYWANRLCKEDFNKNAEIAKLLYELEFKKSESFSDMLELADCVTNEKLLNDKTWGREIYQKALNLSENNKLCCVELTQLADCVANEKHLNDKAWGRELYQKALDLSHNTTILIVTIANSAADPHLLSDKIWAKFIYEKALENAEDAVDYENIASAVAREESLNDKSWAKKLFEKAIERSDGSFDLKRIAYEIAREDILNDKPWAKMVYQKAIDLSESDKERRDVIEKIKDWPLEDTDWADELAQKYNIAL